MYIPGMSWNSSSCPCSLWNRIQQCSYTYSVRSTQCDTGTTNLAASSATTGSQFIV